MKIIGSLIIITCSVIISYIFELKKKDEIKGLHELCQFFEHIKNQIFCFSCPLKNIYRNYKVENIFINDLITKQKIYIYSEDLSDKINACFSVLGKGYKQEQLQSLDYLLIELRKAKLESENSFSQKSKVFRTISFFIACCIVILLV